MLYFEFDCRQNKRAFFSVVDRVFHHICLVIYFFSFQAAKYGDAELAQNISSFVINVMESAVKVWHDTGKVDPRVNFLLDDQKTDTEKYAPVVNIEKVLCCLCLRMLHSPASYKLVPCRNLEVI
jgi:hypothetical protein